MKTTNFFLLLIFGLSLVSCKKKTTEPVTRVVEFNATTYDSLGTYDVNGKPSYLVGRDSVSAALLNFITSTLPEKQDLRKTNPELLTTRAIADIAITQSSEVFITFISQSGSFTNTFSYYTYTTGKPPASTEDIKRITYAFPNAGSRTPLKQGDKLKLGRFEPGTSIGFVILQRAWNNTTHTISNKVVHFCSNDVLNPEVDVNLKKHAVLVTYTPENKVLIGFEDSDRTTATCDHDFNDVVLYATVKP